MQNTNNIIVCDECGSKFEANSIDFKKKQVTIENKSFEVVYYRCITCQKVYIVCMLDSQGKKLQNKYIETVENYRKLYAKRLGSVGSTAKLDQKLNKIETLKNEAMAYQNELLHRYRDLLPGEVFA